MDIRDSISLCGGGKLEIDDVAVINNVTTTRNENPILFLCYLARATETNVKHHAEHHAKLCNVGPGMYTKRPQTQFIERQTNDNIIAWAWLRVFCGVKVIDEIAKRARWRGWNYCLTKFWEMECQLQGSHVFVIKLACDMRPGWITTLWYVGAMLVRDHSADAYLKSMLQTDVVAERMHLLSNTKQRLVNWATDIHNKRRGKMCQWYKGYYVSDAQHPAVIAECAK